MYTIDNIFKQVRSRRKTHNNYYLKTANKKIVILRTVIETLIFIKLCSLSRPVQTR